MEWVAKFFNSGTPETLKLPDSLIQELAAAGFKEFTVNHLMTAYTDKRELSNYLATILRVTHLDRDLIAGIIIERKSRLFRVVKREE